VEEEEEEEICKMSRRQQLKNKTPAQPDEMKEQNCTRSHCYYYHTWRDAVKCADMTLHLKYDDTPTCSFRNPISKKVKR
jgi:hypothetical protein